MRWCWSALAVALTAWGCGARKGAASCRSDSQCSAGQVCFADGCGDPQRNIAVEVVVNAASGHQAQDFVLPEVHGVQDLQLEAPASLQGSIRQDSAQGDPQSYIHPISFLLLGQSAVIPGVQRSYEATVLPQQGSYSISVGTGSFTVTATPSDIALPPILQSGVMVEAGHAAELDLDLPDPSTLAQITGTLVRTGPLDLMPVAMQVQALDPQSLKPLSQRSPVDASGAFTISADPRASSLDPLLIQATPVDPQAPVPSKSFSVPKGSTAALQMGDFGSLVTITGQVVASDGAPVSNATVFFSGTVRGGGTFRSKSVTTDGSGNFSAQTLPSPSSGATGQESIWVIPPAASPAGLLAMRVQVTQAGPLGSVTCPPKVQVSGLVQRSDGSAFSGVHLVATPIQAVQDAPLPANGGTADTDDRGNFALKLDPAVYLLDFTSEEQQLPKMSRYVTVPKCSSVQLDAFPFSKGRTVAGTITAPSGRGASQTAIAPYATVRFFRLPGEGDAYGSVLLADGVADANGYYSVVLPTR